MAHHKPFLQPKKDSGFALLMTLIVVGVVVSVGLSVLDLTIKQVRLSTNAKESERAFHAANAGMECARYWRQERSDQMETGASIGTISCFSTAALTVTRNTVQSSVYRYEYEVSWGASDSSRCTRVVTLVMVAGATNLILNNVAAQVPGYVGASSKTCQAGERCTVISSRGYNQSCGSISGFGTVEREVLLEY